MSDVMRERLERRKGLKTFSHLKHLGRMPSEYEISSTKLGYTTWEFAVETPVVDWYRRYRDGSPLQCSDWDRFYDPRQTFYRRYNEIQNRKETYVDFVLERIEVEAYDDGLSDGWLDVLRVAFSPLRFPVHGLQMIASYYAHLAPSSRIANAAMFQASDEMRRIQRIAYRTKQLDLSRGGFGDGDRGTWEDHPAWQPLRHCLEHLLVTWDWAESFTALNIVLKPQLDELFGPELGHLATTNGDPRLADLLYSLSEDAAWHREWSAALVRAAVEDRPDNRAVLARWVAKWEGPVNAALAGFAEVFEKLAPKPVPFSAALSNVEGRHAAFLDGLGLGR